MRAAERPPARVVVIGDAACDVLVRMQEPLARGADARADIRSRPGGGGANVAAGLARLGVRTHLVCRVGWDLPGRELVEGLEQSGVMVHAARDPSLATGKVVILVDPDGERTMITDRGASLGLTPQDIPEDLFRTGGHLHLSGYLFFEEGPRKAALEALRLASRAGMTVSVDPASSSLLKEIGPGRFLEWTRGMDLCFPNLEEGAVLSGEREPERILPVLGQYYPGVVLKLGAGGAVYAEGGRERARISAEPARVMDTTGAGDAFCAAFLAAWLAGEEPEEALRQGCRLAKRSVERVGARR